MFVSVTRHGFGTTPGLQNRTWEFCRLVATPSVGACRPARRIRGSHRRCYQIRRSETRERERLPGLDPIRRVGRWACDCSDPPTAPSLRTNPRPFQRHPRTGDLLSENRIDDGLDRLLSLADLCRVVCRSRASIYRDIQAGPFPKQVEAGKSYRWSTSDLRAFLATLPWVMRLVSCSRAVRGVGASPATHIRPVLGGSCPGPAFGVRVAGGTVSR